MGLMLPNPNPLEGVIETSYRVFEDGEPRWRDLDIAQLLAFSEPYEIRRLIARNREELEAHGLLVTVTESSGGRPGETNWANGDQFLAICQLSQTPPAREVRIALIRVCKRVRQGIATAPRMELRTLELMAQEVIPPIVKAVVPPIIEAVVPAVVDRAVTPILARMDGIEQSVNKIEQDVNSRKRNPTETDRDFCVRVCARRYEGRCTSCLVVVIVENGKRLSTFNLDHFVGRGKAGLKFIWPVCDKCNRRFEDDPSYRRGQGGLFQTFQMWVDVELKEVGFKLGDDQQGRLF